MTPAAHMGAVSTPSDTVDIKIATPLPSSVLLTLANLVDAAWPGSSWVTNDDQHTNQVVFRVNNAVRQAISADDAADLRKEAAEDDVIFTGVGPEGVSVLTPLEVSANLLPLIKTTFAGYEDATNYLEMPVRDPSDGRVYLLTFCRSAQQTPHELRMAAEQQLADARQRIHREYTNAAWGVRSGARPENAPDTFEAGVNAVLDVLRNLSLPFLEESDV